MRKSEKDITSVVRTRSKTRGKEF